MKNIFASCAILLALAACAEKGVTYTHNEGAVCPAPRAVPADIAVTLEQFPNNSLMKTFYLHYLGQQKDLAAFAQHRPETPNCPSSFWVTDNVAGEFRKYPEGHPMREFFKSYVELQRALDAYYASPAAQPDSVYREPMRTPL